MKKGFQLMLLILTILNSSIVIGQETQPFIENVDAKKFKELVEGGDGVILDVRTPNEVKQGHLINSSNIDYYDKEFERKINLISKDKTMYVYCQSGGRSAEAAAILKDNGFTKIYNLSGGIKAWETEGFPLIKTSNETDEHIQQLSLKEFEKMLKTEKPVLIEFHTVWCAPCRKMAPIIDKLEIQYKEEALILRIDADKSKEVGEAYSISGVPVFILFKDGVEKWRHHGMLSEEELMNQLNKYK